jgi:UDP-2,3-diacylglucosamine pyrophosphatase LpxH
MTMIGSALQRLATPLKARPRFALGKKRMPALLTGMPSPAPAPRGRPLRYRTVFISDTHLGTRGCKAEFLAAFLRRTECETLYLVGDIVDGWRLRRSWYWPATHNDVVQEILRKAREGVRVIYVPGNHDESLRDYTGLNFGGVDLAFDAVHETADGRRFLVIHGDHFDGVVMHARWLATLGDWAYGAALVISDGVSWVRRKFGLSYWSLSGYLKYKVKNAVEYISNYEQALVREARHRKVDGVICGHIHHAEISIMDGIVYCNDGDWVESCTALVEDMAGQLTIVQWHELNKETAAGTALARSA